MHDEANAIIAQLADYNVTAATLAALQTRIDAYRLAIASPKMAIGERSTHTGLLKQEFARADMLVKKRLDGLIRGFEETQSAIRDGLPQRAQDHRHRLQAKTADAAHAADAVKGKSRGQLERDSRADPALLLPKMAEPAV